jgi:outer membrane biogenesis lipoprotein LolB
MKIALILFLLPIIIGCANIQKSKNDIPQNYSEYKKNSKIPEIKNFLLTGKFSLFIKEKGLSGRIQWLSKDGNDTIEIFDPFNSTIAKIYLTKSPKNISFTTPSSSQSKETEKFIRNIFGTSNNIFMLRKFLLSPPIELSNNQNVSINFNGWVIRFKGIYDNIRKISKTVEYTKGNLSLKIFINNLKI